MASNDTEQKPAAPDIATALRESNKKWAEGELLRRFVTVDDLNELLKGGDAGSMVRDGVERHKANKEWMGEWNKTKHLWIEFKKRVVMATLKHMENEQKMSLGTRGKLEELSNEIQLKLNDTSRGLQTMAQAQKLKNTPYGPRAGVKRDTFDMGEVIALRQTMEGLLQVDMDEMVNMLNEDQKFINMMMQEAQKPEGKYFSEGLLSPPTQRKNETEEKWKEREPLAIEEYKGNMGDLVEFVLGPKQSSEKEHKKSDHRKQTEYLMGQDIIKNLNLLQKEDFLKSVFLYADPDQARTFITGCMMNDSITKLDMIQMKNGGLADQFQKTFPDMKEFLRDSVNAKEIRREEAEEYIRQREKPGIKNAAVYFFSWDKLIAENFGRLGAITAVINSVLRISDSITTRHSRHEGTMAAFVRGVGKAVTDKFVIGGVAAAALGASVVYPPIKEAIYSPSDNEKDQLNKYVVEKYVREQATDHPETMNYFAKNFDTLIGKARKNKEEGRLKKPNSKEKVRKFELWPDDVQISPEEAGEMGYKSADEARVAVINLFHICVKKLDMKEADNGEKFKDYLQKNHLWLEDYQLESLHKNQTP